MIYKFEEATPDDLEQLYNRVGFVPVVKYASVDPAPNEVGCVGYTRFVMCDPVIAARRDFIKTSRTGSALAKPALQAECALMGHLFVNGIRRCECCGLVEM
jgi:hypothetical protein